MRALGLLPAFAFLSAVPAFAQQPSAISSGSWIIAGSASFASSHDDTFDRTTTTFVVTPTALYFVLPRLAIGGTVPLGYVDRPNGHSSTYGLGPSARYYFGDPAGQWFSFLSATVQQEWQNTRFEGAIPGQVADVESRGLTLDGSLGLTRLLATHVGVTGEAFYSHMEFKTDAAISAGRQRGHDFGLRFGLTVFLY